MSFPTGVLVKVLGISGLWLERELLTVLGSLPCGWPRLQPHSRGRRFFLISHVPQDVLCLSVLTQLGLWSRGKRDIRVLMTQVKAWPWEVRWPRSQHLCSHLSTCFGMNTAMVLSSRRMRESILQPTMSDQSLGTKIRVSPNIMSQHGDHSMKLLQQENKENH